MIKRAWRLWTAAALAMAISSPAFAQTSQVATSEKAQQLFQAWKDLMSAQQRLMDLLPPTATTLEGFGRRRALRSLGGDARIWISGSTISTEDRARLDRLIWDEMAKLSAGDMDYLKSVIPADGWFRRSRDGAELSDYAIDLLQGSNDVAFRAQVLAAMEPLVKTGEVDARRYASLFDSTEQRAGRLQRFGTMARCNDGRLTILPVADPQAVDDLRRSVGFTDTYAAYGAAMAEKRC